MFDLFSTFSQYDNTYDFKFPDVDLESLSSSGPGSKFWADTLLDESNKVKMEIDFFFEPQQEAPPSTLFNNSTADAVLVLDAPNRTAPDAVLYLTEERPFVSAATPMVTCNSFDPTELYFSPELNQPPGFDINELYATPLRASTKGTPTFNPQPFVAPVSWDAPKPQLPPVAFTTTRNTGFVMDQSNIAPKAVSPPLVLGSMLHHQQDYVQPESFCFGSYITPRALVDSKVSFTQDVQSSLWGNLNRDDYFSSDLRRAQIKRYKEKKATRYNFKRPVDAARSKVAKQRMRNSKGRFTKVAENVNV